MAKPIFVIKVSHEQYEFVAKSFTKLEEQLNDYHLLLATHDKDNVEFEVFNVTNATDIEIEELKAKVLNEISRSL